MGTVVAPFEADTPLPIDPNAELPTSVTAQGLDAIAGQHAKRQQTVGRIENAQPLLGPWRSVISAVPLKLIGLDPDTTSCRWTYSSP
jgi:hypothetical protein